MTLEQFISQKAKQETPGPKGWKERRMPRWKREYEDYKVRVYKERRKAWENSPEGKAEAARRAAEEAKREERFSREVRSLDVGQTLLLKGTFGLVKEGQILSDFWLGHRYYSYSELCHADSAYIPKDIKCVVTRYTRTHDIEEWDWIKIKRIS